MTAHSVPPGTRTFSGAHERRGLAVLIAALLATAACFRLFGLSSVPGISGDEGWWGMQALAWLRGHPYEAHTTSGNPTDLFLLVPVALAHAVAPPSFLLLRAVPALVNLLALPVGFWFVRRLYGTPTAWIFTVGLAVLPTAIAHSRITQDPSQTVFWTGLVIYLAMLGAKEPGQAWGYLGAALLVFPVALWTHPTNVFIAPFLVLPAAAAVRPLLPASRSGRAGALVASLLLAAAGLFAIDLLLEPLVGSHDYLNRPWLSIAAARLADGGQVFEFAVNNARLFNGVTIYHYFSGARPSTGPYDAAFVIVAVGVATGFILSPAARRSTVDRRLILACGLTWSGFYLFAGPQALRPHAERWGLCLVVPAMLVFARGFAAWIEWKPAWRPVPIGAATLVAAGLLASFYVNYFREFATTGGRSHLTYVTAAIEPKRQALQQIVARRTGSAPVTIVARQWWLYWPIAYLATDHPGVSVMRDADAAGGPEFEQAARDGRLFFVEFAGTPELTATIEWIGSRGLRAERTAIGDASGRDLIEVLEVTSGR